MTHDNQIDWPYPGSRWWKFDFHTHTPASADTKAWQDAAGTEQEVTPEIWLRKYMDAGIDCVAVTDHNSGDWIDKLKDAYAKMLEEAQAGSSSNGFRELTLFPGVEISVSGGVHLLAILDPDQSSSDVDGLLGQVGYPSTKKGDSNGVTRASLAQVMEAVLLVGGVPIPAHADGPKGLLRVQSGTKASVVDATTLKDILAIEGLLAVEWSNPESPVPTCVEGRARTLTRVLGSDSHNFRGPAAPGSRFTWVKMAQPCLEGLRLALLDGDGFSVHRSDSAPMEPFRTPKHYITGIEVESARYMGRDSAQRLDLSPYYNAVIGGRGTGKSTLVHALRLAYRREQEVLNLGDRAELTQRFESFVKTARRRDADGALKEDTEIRTELCRDGVPHRLRWRQDGQGTAIEQRDAQGDWRASKSQTFTAERLPVRLFSQGQIAAMAGDGREVLLGIIDEAAGIDGLHRQLDDAKRTWTTQRSRMRELDGHLARRPETERKLAEVKQKLEVLAETKHSEVLKAQQKAVRQRGEVDTTTDQLAAMTTRIEAVGQDLLLDDWPDGIFVPDADQDMLAWRQDVANAVADARSALHDAAASLAAKASTLDADSRLATWRRHAERVEAEYSALQLALAKTGVADSQAFSELLQEREQLERQLKYLDDLAEERTRLETECAEQRSSVQNARKDITDARRKFVQDTLANNRFVRMEVVAFGFQPRNIERSLRELLECSDHFDRDLLEYSDGEPQRGLALDLASTADQDTEQVLEGVKQRLIAVDESFHGQFRNYLKRMHKRPEFADHIDSWFPEDDLRIEYSPAGDRQAWTAITQGSQGQRSAALLAFLLAFGEEPLILDQPEDDLDNHLIYDLIVRQIRENKLRRQLIVVTHNPNVVVNGDAELVHVLDFKHGQCQVVQSGALQEKSVREEVCRVMEGGREAFARRWARLGHEV